MRLVKRNHVTGLIIKKLRAIANGNSFNSLVARPDFTDTVSRTMNRVEDFRRIRVWPIYDPSYDYQSMIFRADETNTDLSEEAFYRCLNRPRNWYWWACKKVPMWHLYTYDHTIGGQYALSGRDTAPDYNLTAFLD